MARIQTYDNDVNLTDSDRLVGTDGSPGADLDQTKNFTLGDLKNYISGTVIDNNDYVRNTTDTFTATPKVKQIVTLSQAEYVALPTYDVNTLYIVL